MTEKIIETNGIKLCTETFGNPSDPCILLVMGATASMIWWDVEFCEKLAAHNRFVIRYDNRDVGRSTTFPKLNYTVADMVDDAIGVLDAHQVKQAHIVGMSLGGMIGQIMAIKAPERVLSITCIASGLFADRPELPGIDPEFIKYHGRAATLDWTSKKAIQEYMVGGWKLVNGSQREFDETRANKLASDEIDRANNLLSMFNHATLSGGHEYYDRSQEIEVPVLIIHGTEDPILPFPHALALQEAFPQAKLVTLEGAGHELHHQDWDLIVKEIMEVTERN